MSDYSQEGNRWIAIFLKRPDGTLVRLPYDLARFNVDTNPDAKPTLVPGLNDDGKIFERIWITDSIPYRKKASFDGIS